MIISVIKKIEVNTFKLKLKKCSAPLDFQHRSKNIDDLNHWKAADLKLFFLFRTYNSVKKSPETDFRGSNTKLPLLIVRNKAFIWKICSSN